MTDPNLIHTALRKIGVRVVPLIREGTKTYELVIEPWCYKTNTKAKGVRRRTGVVLTQKELNTKRDNRYLVELKKIQNKINRKYEN